MNESWINNNDKPLIFLGSCHVMEKFTDVCYENDIEVAGIIDSDYYGNTEELCGISVIDKFDNIEKYKDDYNFFCATNFVPKRDPINIRNTEKRFSILRLIEEHDLNCISLVHSKSSVSRSATIGRGSFVDNMAVLEPNTSIGNHTHLYTFAMLGHNVKMGNNCIVQRRCLIAQDLTVEDNCVFAPNVNIIKSYITIKEGTFVQEGIYLKRGTQKGEVVTAMSSPRVNSIIG